MVFMGCRVRRGHKPAKYRGLLRVRFRKRFGAFTSGLRQREALNAFVYFDVRSRGLAKEHLKAAQRGEKPLPRRSCPKSSPPSLATRRIRAWALMGVAGPAA
jgi:hypothetical protein